MTINRLKSLAELSRFINHWGRKVKTDPTKSPIFECEVTFSVKSRTYSGETICLIERHGYDGGKVKLDETNYFPVSKFHLDFDPGYQAFEVGDEFQLIISGSSSKMGAYSVEIFPLNAISSDEYYKLASDE